MGKTYRRNADNGYWKPNFKKQSPKPKKRDYATESYSNQWDDDAVSGNDFKNYRLNDFSDK